MQSLNKIKKSMYMSIIIIIIITIIIIIIIINGKRNQCMGNTQKEKMRKMWTIK